MHLRQQTIIFVTLSAMEIKFKCTVYLCIPDNYKSCLKGIGLIVKFHIVSLTGEDKLVHRKDHGA